VLDDLGYKVRFPAGLGIFLFTTASRTPLVLTQPPIQWVQGSLSLGVKRTGREADHSPPPSAEVKECVELCIHFPNTPSWYGDHISPTTVETLECDRYARCHIFAKRSRKHPAPPETRQNNIACVEVYVEGGQGKAMCSQPTLRRVPGGNYTVKHFPRQY
jgi:hypothetical protein